jgi:acetate kinase
MSPEAVSGSAVLVLNAGSSTLKWTLLERATRATLRSGTLDWQGDAHERATQLRATLNSVSGFSAVGHRIVHGGERFRSAVVISPEVRRALGELLSLDPLHMRPALAGVDAVSEAFPGVVQIGAFDTAFHATLPEAAAGYGLPYEWSERWGLRRFGFHGLSAAYSLARVRALLGRLPQKLIICHLGSGCSVTAVADGRSVDTSMGFTPLEGVMMATRAGSVDPGLLLYLQLQQGVSAAELFTTLEERSGLLGVSGVSADLRRVLEAAESGVARARLAYERFVLGLRRAVGAMSAVLGGVDTLVFTGGIGENSARVRADIADALAFAGLQLLGGQELPATGDARISAPGSAVTAFVVRAREDLVILEEVLRLTAT